MHSDCVQPFLFEHLDIRGALVCLDGAWRELSAGRDYAPEVLALLGEMSAVTCLITANLKQPGRMTFQLRGDGAVNLLVLDCDEQLRLRGMARAGGTSAQTSARDLLGNGRLLLSLDAAGLREPYQSLVPLRGESIAAIFEHYLDLSEQQPTRVVLAADARRAAGLLLQKLPDADRRDADGWNRICHLANTLAAPELLTHAPLDLLSRLFPEEEVRVFAPRPVAYHCPEDAEKIHAMLRGLGRGECDAILAERGEIHVRDDICNRDYRFDAAAIEALFAAPAHRMH
ncbi:Hsp33 family molecular chaperone HslO [bacterium]|nr:Hsp33 family molecular chaperone HslO [bacterium]